MIAKVLGLSFVAEVIVVLVVELTVVIEIMLVV